MRLVPRLFFAAVLFVSGAAVAQNNRSFVATTGSDLNNCTAGNDCRSFTHAMTMTNSGGEIIALDSGGFGPFTASKSITVAAAPGAYAAITVPSGNGVNVLAGSSGRVILRGLNIIVAGGNEGVEGDTFLSLVIERCNVTGGAGGVFIAGNNGQSSLAEVVDTTVGDVSAWAFEIISRATLIRCRGERSLGGLYVHDETGFSDAVVVAKEFVSLGNTVGITMTCFTAGHTESLDIDQALIAHNVQDGVQADSNSGAVIVRVVNSTVVENGMWGFQQMNSAVFGTHNNIVEGNGSGNGTGSFTPIFVF